MESWLNHTVSSAVSSMATYSRHTGEAGLFCLSDAGLDRLAASATGRAVLAGRTVAYCADFGLRCGALCPALVVWPEAT